MSDTFKNILKQQDNPFVWYGNIGVEYTWSNVKTTDNYRLNNIEEICMLLSRKEDLLICNEVPNKELISYLESLDFETPQFLQINKSCFQTENEYIKKIKSSFSNFHGTVFPYAYDNFVKKAFKNIESLNSSQNAKKLNNKLFAKNILNQKDIPYPIGFNCNSVDQALRAFEDLFNNHFFEKVIIKKPFGASGNGLYLTNSLHETKSISRIFLIDSPKILLEGFYEGAENFNYQLYIDNEGNIDVFQISRQIMNQTIYIGSEFGSGIYKDYILSQIEEYGIKVGKILYNAGARGVVGIDGIIHKDKIYPSLDVNVRCTMSTYLYSLVNRENIKQKHCFSLYKNIVSSQPITYELLLKKLESNKILYTLEKGYGIIVYIAGTLPTQKTGKGLFLGRIYYVIIAETKTLGINLKHKFDEIIKKISESG